MTSETIGALAHALSKAQAEIDGAAKDSTNPYFSSKYADLASVWAACRGPLAAHGLAVVQTVTSREGRDLLVTTLVHSSGEWMRGEIPLLLSKADMQGLGSAITYARRYGLAAIVGVSPEDDDGNAAVASAPAKAPKPEGYDDWRDTFVAVSDNGLPAMTEMWAKSPEAYRIHWGTEPKATRDALRAKAQAVGRA